MLICAVGGKDNFKRFFDNKIKLPLINADAFEKIAVITDRDDREIESIELSVKNSLSSVNAEIINNSWQTGTYINSYGIEKQLQILLTVIPEEQQGALETIMLSAISENPYDANIVEKAGRFSHDMRTEAEKYISNNRLELKAHLGITWAVQYPEKVFSLIDEQIKNVPWESSDVLTKCFNKLIEI